MFPATILVDAVPPIPMRVDPEPPPLPPEAPVPLADPPPPPPVALYNNVFALLYISLFFPLPPGL